MNEIQQKTAYLVDDYVMCDIFSVVELFSIMAVDLANDALETQIGLNVRKGTFVYDSNGNGVFVDKGTCKAYRICEYELQLNEKTPQAIGVASEVN